MSKYDEILEIFESQKKEISKLTNKVNELEETNAFLITILEKSKTLPPVYDPNSLRKDKLAAIEIEHSLRSIQEKNINPDSTQCETTLNDSYDENLITFNNPNSLGWSTDSSSNQKFCSIKPSQEIKNTHHGGQDNNINHSNFESNNLNLRISDTSPVRRKQSQPVISFISNPEKTTHSDNISKNYSNISDADKFKNEANLHPGIGIDNNIALETEKIPTSKENSESVPLFSKTVDPKSSLSCNESSTANTVACESVKDIDVEHALDYLIEKLQNSTKLSKSLDEIPLHSSSQERPQSSTQPGSIYSDYVNDLIVFKDQYNANDVDRNSQMRLLVSTQQMKVDLLHKSLEKNKISNVISSNQISEKEDFKINETSTSEMSTPVPLPSSSTALQSVSESVLPNHLSNLKLYRERELARLNNEKMLQCPRIRNGFVKFTALIKGYIVRTLYETDKVQNIIITIKDTAQLAIKLRQERLSGDNSQSDECTTSRFFTRRNNQEIISFQQRLVSQIKAALSELHDIFFTWPSFLQMRLMRNHIDQIMISTTSRLQNNGKELLDPETSMDPHESRTKSSAKLSSATLKRRQKLALRSNNFKENRNKNIQCSSPRKPVLSTTYGCRGYAVGSHSRTTNSQSKIGSDRKSRTGNVSHRRSSIRTIVKHDVNTIPANIKSSSTTNEFQRSQTLEPDSIKTLSKEIFKCHQQQQQQSRNGAFEPPQNNESKINVRSQKSSRLVPDKSNLVNVKCVNGINNFFPSVPIDGDSIEGSFHPKILSTISPSVQKMSHIDADQTHWRSRTYKLYDENKINSDINRTWSKNQKIKLSDCDDQNQNSSSRIEVDINDVDMGYLCENNSHYNECNDSTESNTTVVVDLLTDCKVVNSDSSRCKSPCISSNKTLNSRVNHFTRQPLFKPYLNNTALNYLKPDFDVSTKNEIIPNVKSQFKIRKRIVACSSVYSSTVSHN